MSLDFLDSSIRSITGARYIGSPFLDIYTLIPEKSFFLNMLAIE